MSVSFNKEKNNKNKNNMNNKNEKEIIINNNLEEIKEIKGKIDLIINPLIKENKYEEEEEEKDKEYIKNLEFCRIII